MSRPQDSPTADMVAVACVVDSSLELQSEWIRVVIDYISPMLKRLSEIYVDYQFRIAFITYATAETRPTPLLAKRFFAPIAPVTKELREDHGKLGIGQTTSGGGRGMAALEGLVAAIELFDVLRTANDSIAIRSQNLGQMTTPRTLVCHMIHVAAAPADGAERPMYNRSPELDSTTWETLPSELRKRNIFFSVIKLRQLPRFAEIHTAVAAGNVQQPWFNVHSQHSISLNGYPTTAPRSAKRASDGPVVDRSPESKRAKMSLAKTEVTPPATATVPTIPNKLPAGALAQIMEKFRIVEMAIHQLEKSITSAIEMGDLQSAENLKKDRAAKLAMREKIKAMIMTMAKVQGHVPPQAPPNNAGSSNEPGPSAPLASSKLEDTLPAPASVPIPVPAPVPVSVPPTSHENVPPKPEAPRVQLMHKRTPSGSAFPHISNQAIQVPGQLPPQMATQMQKMLEQRSRPPAHMPAPVPQPLPQQQQPEAGSSAEGAKPAGGNNTRWVGTLMWTGSDAITNNRKDMQADVAAIATNGDIKPELWPSSLLLVPSRELAGTMPELQNWIKRHKPILCNFQAHARGTDPKTNELSYRSLLHLLTDRKVYAIGGWNLSSGAREDRILIFPVGKASLGGAIFVDGPMPDPPRMSMSPAMIAQLQKLNPEQRQQLLTRMMMRQKLQQQQQLMQQQQHHQQEAANAAGFNPQAPSFPNIANLMTMGAVPLPHRPVNGGGPSVGVGMGVSAEMLQSFMQRNEGGSGMGSG